MIDFLQRLWHRRMVQWPLAYIAAAFALIQVVDAIGGHFSWPASTGRYLILVLAVGFFVALVFAWYHGERGAQRFGSAELLIIALLLAIGALVVGHFGPLIPAQHAATSTVASASMQAEVVGPNGPVASRATIHAAPEIAAQPIPAKSIAVLPFENLSSDKENEYFVSGMQDLILGKLADIGELKVISRTSTMRYKSRPDNLRKVAAELGVATILEGSVQKQGKRVLISVQLIDAASDTHLWANTYNRTLEDIFGVEGEVAQTIATALQATLSASQTVELTATPTTNQAAYDLFLRAEFEANKGRMNYATEYTRAAIPLYRQAVAQDPEFAQAFARLSYEQSYLAWLGGGGEDVKQLNLRARADAERAQVLQPGLFAAQMALGFCDYYGRVDYPAALQVFAAAQKLKPNDPSALAAWSFVARRLGRFDEAIASFRRGLVFDPRNFVLARELGATYLMAGRYAEAEGAIRRALALDPGNRTAKRTYASLIVLDTGDIPRALAVVQGEDPALKFVRVRLLTLQRRYADAFVVLDGIPDTPDNNYTMSARGKTQMQADLYALMGDLTRARTLYAQALPRARAQLANQHGIYRAWGWQNVADIELGLGHTTAALEAIARSRSIDDQYPDETIGPGNMVINAQLYVQARRPDLAVPLLALALAKPGIGQAYSPVLLWLDPAWDPIRKDPRFRVLLRKYAKDRPAVTYDDRYVSAAALR